MYIFQSRLSPCKIFLWLIYLVAHNNSTFFLTLNFGIILDCTGFSYAPYKQSFPLVNILYHHDTFVETKKLTLVHSH